VTLPAAPLRPLPQPPPLIAQGLRRRLVRLLRAAHAGERAAALAYRGHARSVTDPAQAGMIRRIEAEEWAHRARLGAMLQEQGSTPARWREVIFQTIGLTLGAACRWSGWYLPMYGAGWIEAINVQEYLTAAALAATCAEHGYAAELLLMAQCEREHEAYFRGLVAGCWQTRWLGLWRAPPAPPEVGVAAVVPTPVGAVLAPGAPETVYLPAAPAVVVGAAAGP